MLARFHRRFYSTEKLPQIQSNLIQIQRTKSPKKLEANKDLVFGKSFTDHMLSVKWNASKGWQAPLIQPYGPISLEPSAVVFHYSMECFEGMKAYKDKKGNIRLFRPDMNMKRLNSSCSRLTLPTFDEKELLQCIKSLVKLDERWIPQERGYSLYIRPTVIGTQQTLGVGPSSEALLFVIMSPVGPYYKTGFNAVSLLADPSNVRAWPGGVGGNKVGGNYAPGILTQIKAAKEGFQQNLWLFPAPNSTASAPDHMLTEVGTMNCFVYLKNINGEKELVTPVLDGTILPGVTRDSILQLARKWGEFKVSERLITMSEVVTASKEGRLLEVFGAGTAAIVSPVKHIRYITKKDANGNVLKYEDIHVPLDPKDSKSQAGPLTKRFADAIMGIQYGEVDHEWSVVLNK